MIEAYAWAPGSPYPELIKVKPFADDELDEAKRWVRNSKLPCKAIATTPEDIIRHRELLWNHN